MARIYPSSADCAIVVGGGLAGVTAAHALAERGVAVTLLERQDIACGASGNAGGVLYPQLTKKPSLATQWYVTAYDFMLGQLARWRAAGYRFGGAECGMVRFARHAPEDAQLREAPAVLGLAPEMLFWQEAEAISACIGIAVPLGGLYFPRGSWVAVAELCQALSRHPLITVVPQEARRLQREDGGWRVGTAGGESFAAPHVVMAGAHETSALLPDIPWRLHAVGGQVSRLSGDQVAAPLSTILCLSGYIIPLGTDYLIGATYSHGPDALAVREEHHAKNRADAERILPGWVLGMPHSGRSAYRATTPDRLPYAGAVEPGLWVSVGHGSRGLLSAPLCAQILARAICGEAPPVSAALLHALRPLRFAGPG